MATKALFDENKVKKLKIWSVFVGGTEVNDYYLTYEQANRLMQEYIDDDYDDIEIIRSKCKYYLGCEVVTDDDFCSEDHQILDGIPL